MHANDIHAGAVEIMESALSAAGLSDFVHTSSMDCYDLGVRNASIASHVFVATNPPWGVRLTEEISESWEGLRHFIRNKTPNGTKVFILSGDKSATATLKLKRDRMVPLQTGEQHLRWIQYTIRGTDDIATNSEERPEYKVKNVRSASKPIPINRQSQLPNEWL
jgi:23S rRNA G2445 N2-methylase RlmL